MIDRPETGPKKKAALALNLNKGKEFTQRHLL